MKKIYIKLIALVSLTSLLLAGCGNTATDTENSTPTESQASESVESEVAEESIESEVAEPATEEVVESEVVESTDEVIESEEDPASDDTNADEVALPEDRAWVDDLYNKLVAKDYEAVIDIIISDEVAANAEPYAYYEYVYDATGYKLVTSDGKYVGLILSHIEGEENVAFYSEAEDRDYGFTHTEAGDIVVSTWISTISGERDYRWFDGTNIHFSNGNSSELLEGDIYAVWEM